MTRIVHNNELKNNESGEFVGQSGARCRYGMFTRHGGVSSRPYASLNIGAYVGDLPEAVAANRRLVREALHIPALLSARQVHGPGIFCLTEPLQEDQEVEGFDALVTDQPGVGLMIQQADCQAILLFDPGREVIAAVHCGWRGSVQGIGQQVVKVMADSYGSLPADLQAVISPSLGPCCAEFVNYKSELPPDFQQYMVRRNYFDFWQITRKQLSIAGVEENNMRIAGHCTCCSDDYFSYRRATRLGAGVTGRNCSVITLAGKDV